jgi:hypothetical protein
MKDEFQNMTEEEFNEMVESIKVSNVQSTQTETEEGSYRGNFNTIDYLAADQAGQAGQAGQKEQQNALPTPLESPNLASLFASALANQGAGLDSPTDVVESSTNQKPRSRHLWMWKATFLAGRLIQPQKHYEQTFSKATMERLMRQPGGLSRIHWKNLPPEPACHRDLERHPLGALFKQAEVDHLKSHKEMNTWQEVEKAAGKKVLDCKWVYAYKFDKHG